MFDGTDLSVAYGSYNDQPSQSASFNNPYQSMAPPAQSNPVEQVPKATASHAMPPDPVYAPPPAMYAQQSAATPKFAAPPSDSLWDRIAMKKWEVFKFFLMSLIIVLALAIDNVAAHYMSAYIAKSFLTENQEMLVRFAYPVGIVLLIWVLKASV